MELPTPDVAVCKPTSFPLVWIVSLSSLIALPRVAAAGGIAGTVRAAATELPLAGRVVLILDELGQTGSGITDSEGRYRLDGLAGTYYAYIEAGDGFLGQTYLLHDCEPDDCGFHPPADPIVVGGSELVTGIDFALVRPATIEGRITDAFTGLPLRDITLRRRFPGQSGFDGQARTDDQGNYRLEFLSPGTYLLHTRNFDEYVDEIFDDVPCGGSEGLGCPQELATPIELEPGEEFRADFALEPGGVIAGTVREAVTGEPLQAFVDLWSSIGVLFHGGSGLAGQFEFRGLGAGTYYLVADTGSSPHVAEIYDGLHCPEGRTSPDCDPTEGTGIPVSTGQATVAAVVLDRYGQASGRVRDASTGSSLDDFQVIAFRPNGQLAAFGRPGEGTYTIDVPPGLFKLVAVVRSRNYVDQLYPGLPCVGGVCDLGPGATLISQLNGHIEDVDFDLAEGGILAGRMTLADSGAPFSGLLGLHLPNGRRAFVESADQDGHYEFDGLATGSYFVTTRAFFGVVNEVYDDVPCMLDFCEPERLGTPVAVTAGGRTEGIDFTLDVGGEVAGEIRSEEGERLGFVFVSLWTEDGEFVASDQAGVNGYSISQLPPGSYRATTNNLLQLADELYDDRPCPGGVCDVAEGDPIEVRRGETTAGIDFELGPFAGVPCSAEDGRICLGGDRFQVAMRWADGAGGSSGAATGVPLTEDSGYFWFFREENVEALVKVLDACAPPFNRFWVFAAGLTNVATELEVLDSWSGVTYRHSTDQGPAFAPVLDTSAFATCGVPEPTGAIGAVRSAPPSHRSGAGSGSSGPCVEGPTRLCLGGGRFAVEATWTTSSGSTGVAQAAPLTSDTGTFWFFNADNLELIVKVLDACGPPFDRFWVFAAGLTNVEVSLHVTDLVTSETWTRTNPLGQAFQPILDTGAFDTCP